VRGGCSVGCLQSPGMGGAVAKTHQLRHIDLWPHGWCVFLVGRVGLLASPGLSGLISLAIDWPGPLDNAQGYISIMSQCLPQAVKFGTDCVVCPPVHLDLVAMPAKRALASGDAPLSASAKKRARTENSGKKRKQPVKEEEPFVASCAGTCVLDLSKIQEHMMQP
jgi:hypothetical protein